MKRNIWWKEDRLKDCENWREEKIINLPSKSVSGNLGDNANNRPPKPQPMSATSTSFEILLLVSEFSSCPAPSGWSVCMAEASSSNGSTA